MMPSPAQESVAGVGSRKWYWVAACVGLPVVGLVCQWSGDRFELPRLTFAAGVLLALLLVCTITDLAQHKIYNWATYSAFFLAVLFNVGVSSSSPATSEVSESAGKAIGAVGIGSCLLGALACFVALLIAYSLSSWRGAGDVKLATALGAWLGVQQGLLAVCYTYIVAGAALFCFLLICQGPLTLLGHFSRQVGALLVPGWIAPPARLAQLDRPVPMAAFFAIGTLLAMFEVFAS